MSNERRSDLSSRSCLRETINHGSPCLVFSKRALLALLTLLVLVPFAWGYINGGDFHSTLKSFEKSLKAGGWGTHFGTALPADCDRTGQVTAAVKVVPQENPDYQQWVNEQVGRAVQSLPEKQRDKIGVETKREIARLAREAIQEGVSQKQHLIKKAATGTVQYQVGVFEFESYWETNYGGKRKIHAKRTGLVPFVALRVIEME
jgi:hypothetical protein